MANLGSTTPSMAAARMGMGTSTSPMRREMSISSGLMVTFPGTRATSSKP